MYKNLFNWFLGAFVLLAASALTACSDDPDEDLVKIYPVEVSPAQLTFDENGGAKQFTIQTEGRWEITGHENIADLGLTPVTEGRGDQTITVSLGSVSTARQIKLLITSYSEIAGREIAGDGKELSIIQTSGGSLPTGDVVYDNNFDKEPATQTYGTAGSSWPYLDQFDGWQNQTGKGADNVTYASSSCSARANSVSSGNYSNYAGSGTNNILFGGGGYLTVGNIALDSRNLQLTFGTEKYAYGSEDNTFVNAEFNVTLSQDGENWSDPIAYTFPASDDTNGRWSLATADFTLPEGTTTLYIRFASTLSGAHRLDDVKLVEGIGGQQISFTGGGEDPGPGPVGDAIYANDFDKEPSTQTYGTAGSSWPYLDQFAGWQNQNGTGATNVTYDYTGCSVRTNSASNGGYSNYAGSGTNNLLFGTGGYLTVGNIAVGTQNLRLTFGTEKYAYGVEDNTFVNAEFNVTLSQDGQNWSAPIAYTFPASDDTNGRWSLATADFTLPSGTTTLYIRFASTLSGAHRLDDVTLAAGNGGQEISFGGGGGGENPDPVSSIYANDFDKELATQAYGTSGSNWPYLDEFAGWQNQSGTGATNVTYDYSGCSARANSASNGNYSNYAGSGSNNLLFGTSAYFTIGNIAVGTQNLQLTFGTEKYAYGVDDNTFVNAEFNVTLSQDGQNWSAPIAYTLPATDNTNGRWSLATADFTLPAGTTTLYIRFASTLASAHRLDDVTLAAGNGGQEITFGGGDSGETPDPVSSIYLNNLDKTTATKTYGTSGNNWPYLDQFDGWQNQSGTGVANVTYDYSGCSARANSVSNGDYSNYDGSGANNIFFGTSAYFTIGNIAVSTQNLQLTFGTERYLQSADNTFVNTEFNVTLSQDGQNWSAPIAYTLPATDNTNGRWSLATADFTLPAGTTTLYIRFASTLTSAHRLDDIELKSGNGGQQITFVGGDTPAEPVVVTANYTDLTAETVTLGGSYSGFASAPTAVGVQWIEYPASGTITEASWSGASNQAASSVQSPFTVSVTGLLPETQYAYRAYADAVSGDYKTFVTPAAGQSEVTTISIPELIAKFSSSAAVIDADKTYSFTGVVASDATGSNYSYGSVYVITKGSTAAGNGICLYNSALHNKYALGDEITVTLPAGVAQGQLRYGAPQVSQITDADVTLVSTGNAVTPATITIDQVASYVCMPVTIAGVTAAQGGQWMSSEANTTHNFTVGDAELLVYLNRNAYSHFADATFAATTGAITGIAALYNNNPEVLPRTLADVSAFSSADPVITDVTPSSLSFTAEGGSKSVTVTVANGDGCSLRAQLDNSNFTATVAGFDVTVSAPAATAAQSASLTITLVKGGADIATRTVAVSQSGPSSSTSGYRRVTDITSGKKYLIVAETGSGDFVFENAQLGSKANGVAVTVDNRTIAATNELDAMAVTFVASGSEWTIQTAEGNWVEYNSSTNLRVAATSQKTWTASAADNETFLLRSTETLSASSVRALLYQHTGDYSRFGGYAASNANNGEYFTVALYEQAE